MAIPGHITLLKNITAIQIQDAEDGKQHYGRVSPLAKGAELQPCGDGFMHGTATVECEGRLYFVFLQDVEG